MVAPGSVWERARVTERGRCGLREEVYHRLWHYERMRGSAGLLLEKGEGRRGNLEERTYIPRGEVGKHGKHGGRLLRLALDVVGWGCDG
jgi:hypothetical protein